MSKRVVIDPGHGGDDPGSIANNIIEKDLNLKISKYIKNRFDELGIASSITRDNDETISPDDRVAKALNFYGNDKDVIILSNHINAGKGDGAEVIYSLRNNDTLSKKISDELSNAGQNVRKYYQKRLPSDSSKDYYFMLRNTPNTESIIIEYGFIDSTGDDIEQLKNYEILAEAVVKAVANYIGVPYNNSSEYYEVAKGDSLWSIAKKFNTTVDKLKDINNLKNNTIQIGQKLIIKEIPNDYYVVKSGDTLYSIAKKYNTTVTNLKSLNNLNNNMLSINQVIKVPNIINTYTVEKGDTLYSISRKFNTTVSTLIDLNNLSTSTLSIGQKLILPN